MYLKNSKKSSNKIKSLITVAVAAIINIGFIQHLAAQTLPVMTAPTKFTHPGILFSQADLDNLPKGVVVAPDNIAKAPYLLRKQTYLKLINSKYAALNYKATPFATVLVTSGVLRDSNINLVDDALASYIQSVLWVATGNDKYRLNAMNILSAWSGTFKEIVVKAGEPKQPRLVSAWATAMFANAGEILRHHKKGAAKWPATHITRFSKMLDILYTYYKPGMEKNGLPGNWGTAISVAAMSQGVFQENAALYKLGKEQYLKNLRGNIKDTGEVLELKSRDCYHPEFTMINAAHIGKVDKNQGLNQIFNIKLDGDTIPRYAMGLEYLGRNKYQTISPIARDCSNYIPWDGYGDIAIAAYPKDIIPTFHRYINESRDKMAVPVILFPSATQFTHGPSQQ